MPYTHVPDLAGGVEIPKAGTLSQTVYKDDDIKAVVFAFDTDQELSEHTAASPAVVQVLEGRLELTLDGESVDAGPGSWVHMPAGLPHAVKAREPTVMLLTLIHS